MIRSHFADLSESPNIFQKWENQFLEELNGILSVVISDDILVLALVKNGPKYSRMETRESCRPQLLL